MQPVFSIPPHPKHQACSDLAGAVHQEALHQGSWAQALHPQQNAQCSPACEPQAASSFTQASAQQPWNNQADQAAGPVDWQQNALYASDMPAYPSAHSPAVVTDGLSSQLGSSRGAAPIAIPITAPTAAPIAARTAAPISAPTNAPIYAPVAAPLPTPIAAPIPAPTTDAEAKLVNCHQPAEVLTAAQQQAAHLVTAAPKASVTPSTAGRHAAGATLSPTMLRQTVPVHQAGRIQEQHEPAAAIRGSLKQAVSVSQASMTQQQQKPAAAIQGSAQMPNTGAVPASSNPEALHSLPGMSLHEAEPLLQLIDRLQAAGALAAPSSAVTHAAACEEPVLSQADLVPLSEGRSAAECVQAHTLDRQHQVCRQARDAVRCCVKLSHPRTRRAFAVCCYNSITGIPC